MAIDFSKTIIIIPTYNEKGNIANLARSVFQAAPGIAILVVDDNSPDGTADTVRKSAAEYPNLEVLQRAFDRGFGKSYLAGFSQTLAARGWQNVVMMDADFSHDPKEVPEMVNKLADYDIVVGSRYVRGGRIENWNWRRRLLSRFANFYARMILGVPILDLTAGFMCFRKNILRSIDLDSIKSEGYAFLVELKYKMLKSRLKITEHPIVFIERREGQSKMSFKNIWEAVLLPWKLRFSK